MGWKDIVGLEVGCTEGAVEGCELGMDDGCVGKSVITGAIVG